MDINENINSGLENRNSHPKNKPLPPFACTYSPNVPELLNQMNISLAVSTYQAGKVIMLSAPTPEKLVQLPRNFQTPMGIAINQKKMAIATQGQTIVLANSPGLAPNYPPKPNTYDALYLPRTVYYTGFVNMHDIEWANGNLYGVITLFSCLATIDEEYSFKPIWKPDFISELAPEDRCHLNGMALKDGVPKYVTALGTTNHQGGWREKKHDGGVVIDIETNEIILENLPMPHSPRIFNGKLYVLLSAAGKLVEVDIQNKSYKEIVYVKGYARGMDIVGDYLFIGLSKLRHTTSVFGDLDIAKESQLAGIIIVYLPYGNIVGHIKYETSVEEIYDIKVLKNTVRPCILNTDKEATKMALSTPNIEFWAKDEEKKNQIINKRD